MVRVKDRDVTSREAIIGTNPLGTFGRWREEFPSKKSRVENLCARRLVGAAAGGPTAFAVGVLGVRTKFEKALRGGYTAPCILQVMTIVPVAQYFEEARGDAVPTVLRQARRIHTDGLVFVNRRAAERARQGAGRFVGVDGLCEFHQAAAKKGEKQKKREGACVYFTLLGQALQP